ncbi:MAG: glycosyltransferase [Chlorobiaceae bacterium]|nr:glycosyltransferase [Chlorobiaceae bacterium]
MRIILDLQSTQKDIYFQKNNPSSIAYAHAILRNRGEHEIIIALSGLYAGTIEPIRGCFDGFLSQEKICVWQVPDSLTDDHNPAAWKREVAERIRSTFLCSLKPDVVLLFTNGSDDDLFTASAGFDPQTLFCIAIPDNIQQLPPSDLQPAPKSDLLHRAQLLLVPTESSRLKAIEVFGISADSVINVSRAIEPRFSSISGGEVNAHLLRENLGLTKPFIMCAINNHDAGSNLSRLVSSYAQLPMKLRAHYQLVLTGKISAADHEMLQKECIFFGLPDHSLVYADCISEEESDTLYNVCKVTIVPFWHEEFCSPALKAMSCGKAVIAPNNADMLEVTGLEDALFDADGNQALVEKLIQVLTDENFLRKLEKHSTEQACKFSWDSTGRRVLEAFENRKKNNSVSRSVKDRQQAGRPKLAYISPLLPERSDISEYSAVLLPQLSRYYDIDVVVHQKKVSDQWIKANCTVRSVEWFKKNAHHYERVLYHFGNSPVHQHMYGLLEKVPGIVVLHDFFLSGVLDQMDTTGIAPDIWKDELYHAHGYPAIQQLFHSDDKASVLLTYPCNYTILQNAQGVIVHSEYSLQLARQWYGVEKNPDYWAVIPHLRPPVSAIDRVKARNLLRIEEDRFVVCSVGTPGPLQLTHRLIKVWLESDLARHEECLLVFVGENPDNDYGQDLLAMIKQSGLTHRIRITGRVNSEEYRQYLSAANAGIQLRTHSRGEAPGPVLDCLNYALPTIINANGSMADLPSACTIKLPDEFTDDQLKKAMETLWCDAALCQNLGSKARDFMHQYHHPEHVAEQYVQAIENFSHGAEKRKSDMIRSISAVQLIPDGVSSLLCIAQAVANTFTSPIDQKQLLIDVSALVHEDMKTGIQRVVRSIVKNLIECVPDGYRVEPVYATSETSFRYARNYMLKMLGCPEHVLADDPIEIRPQDILFIPDLHYQVIQQHQQYLLNIRNRGGYVYFLVHDLLPLQYPEYFPAGTLNKHREWLDIVMQTDGAICVSQTIADELFDWISRIKPDRHRPFAIGWNHNAADIEGSVPSKGYPAGFDQDLEKINANPSFLMVGTVEPRKGHAQTLKAFTLLWNQGVNVNLVIVGKQGWMVDVLAESIKHHKELNKRLFWFQGISDEALLMLYKGTTGTIMASEGEGFGLPLIEAAQHGSPLLARNIPVFREIAGEHAAYFTGNAPEDLAYALKNWLIELQKGTAPKSTSIPWITWKENAAHLVEMLTDDNDPQWVHSWPKKMVRAS